MTKMDVTGQSRVGYGYDARGRLVSQKEATGRSYEYDPLGNRSAVIINGVRTDLLVDPLGGTDGLGDVLSETTNAAIDLFANLSVEARFDSTGAARFYGGDLQGAARL
ncbi:MAG: RHS repeat domain-containing protein [Gemmataceae bacterium]